MFNAMSKNSKIIYGVLIVVIAVFGISFGDRKSEPKDYYDTLAEGCQSRTSKACCRSSVDVMRAHNYKLIPEGPTEICPEGYARNGQRCLDSYRWCQPL